MTRDEIMNMPAGREMDALIAEKVMGLCAHDWKLVPQEDENGVCRICLKCHLEFWGLHPPAYGRNYESYSMNISAAWEVVEKMKSRGWSATVQWDNLNELPDEEVAYMWHGDFDFYTDNVEDFREGSADAQTAPLAICRAALLAVIEQEHKGGRKINDA